MGGLTVDAVGRCVSDWVVGLVAGEGGEGGGVEGVRRIGLAGQLVEREVPVLQALLNP